MVPILLKIMLYCLRPPTKDIDIDNTAVCQLWGCIYFIYKILFKPMDNSSGTSGLTDGIIELN